MLSVVIVATDNEQRAVLQVLVDGTAVARTVLTCASFPEAASDPVIRRVRAANPDVLLVDIPSDGRAMAMRAIELLHQELPDSAVFAIGSLNQPQVIVSAMRAGASEFIDRPTATAGLLEAFVRLTTARRRVAGNQSPGDLPGSADPYAPVCSPLKPKPHVRSGGAMAVPEPDDAARVFPEMKLLQQQKSKLTQLEQELFQRLWDAGYRPSVNAKAGSQQQKSKLTQLEQELFQRLWDALCQPQTRDRARELDLIKRKLARYYSRARKPS
jgi:DNA-binding NarL/FixJ family response regulator